MRLNAKELIADARVTAPTLPPAAAKLMTEMADRLDVQFAALCGSREQVKQLVAENYDLKHPGTYLPSKCDTPATDAAIAPLRAEGVKALPCIQECDLKALLRFNETCEDGEGYDIGEEVMNRLVEIGLCRKGPRRVRNITPFGQWVIDAQEGEIDLTPLRTESDVNADFSAHIAQLRSQSEQVKGVQS